MPTHQVRHICKAHKSRHTQLTFPLMVGVRTNHQKNFMHPPSRCTARIPDSLQRRQRTAVSKSNHGDQVKACCSPGRTGFKTGFFRHASLYRKKQVFAFLRSLEWRPGSEIAGVLRHLCVDIHFRLRYGKQEVVLVDDIRVG